MKKRNELFPICQEKKFGYIDKTGKVVIAPQFDRATSFYDGMAIVNIGGRHKFERIGKTRYKTEVFVGGEYGYMDILISTEIILSSLSLNMLNLFAKGWHLQE